MSQAIEVREHFDRKAATWHARYHDVRDIRDYELTHRRDLILQIIPLFLTSADAQIVEIGCGTGDVIAAVVDLRPHWRGLGLDVSEGMIDRCHETYPRHPRLSFLQRDVLVELPAVDADAVLAMGVVDYLQQPAMAFAHVHAALKPGGLFVFTVNKRSLPAGLTWLYRCLRAVIKLPRAGGYSHSFPLDDIRAWMHGKFEILRTCDFNYLPYIPGVRRWIAVNKTMEYLLGRRITPLALTTLFVTRKT